jgi:hypothetical protein
MYDTRSDAAKLAWARKWLDYIEKRQCNCGTCIFEAVHQMAIVLRHTRGTHRATQTPPQLDQTERTAPRAKA